MNTHFQGGKLYSGAWFRGFGRWLTLLQGRNGVVEGYGGGKVLNPWQPGSTQRQQEEPEGEGPRTAHLPVCSTGLVGVSQASQVTRRLTLTSVMAHYFKSIVKTMKTVEKKIL